MKTADVMALLQANRNERGVEHWNKLGDQSDGLKSLGIGLTLLRKLARQIGRDAGLAAELWRSDVYDAKVIALLIDDPKTITREQAEAQVEQLGSRGMLAHVFASCDATLAKAPFAGELANKWMVSEDPIRQRCGFGLLYELSKSKKKSAPDDAYFLGWIEHIRTSFDAAQRPVQGAMGGALMGIGKRNSKLNADALQVARDIGPVRFDDDNKCEPLDVVKHLTSDALRKKLGV